MKKLYLAVLTALLSVSCVSLQEDEFKAYVPDNGSKQITQIKSIEEPDELTEANTEFLKEKQRKAEEEEKYSRFVKLYNEYTENAKEREINWAKMNPSKKRAVNNVFSYYYNSFFFGMSQNKAMIFMSIGINPMEYSQRKDGIYHLLVKLNQSAPEQAIYYILNSNSYTLDKFLKSIPTKSNAKIWTDKIKQLQKDNPSFFERLKKERNL